MARLLDSLNTPATPHYYQGQERLVRLTGLVEGERSQAATLLSTSLLPRSTEFRQMTNQVKDTFPSETCDKAHRHFLPTGLLDQILKNLLHFEMDSLVVTITGQI